MCERTTVAVDKNSACWRQGTLKASHPGMVSVRFTEQPSPRTPIIREVAVSRQGDGSRRPALKYGRSATTVPVVEGGPPRRVRFHLPGVTSVTNTATTAPSGHETRYRHGTLPSPLASTLADNELLLAARHSHETLLADLLRRAALHGAPPSEINQGDSSGRTVLSYIASNGSVLLLDLLLQVPGVDVNKPDNEGNAPLHFSAQAGQVETINYLLSRCSGIEIDARNNLGFTPLMKAAIQGRTKCAKLLIFAGASPIMRDTGRGLRAEQWARFCGRYVCADVIEKFARHRLLERSTSYGRWGSEPELGPHLINGRLQPPVGTIREQSSGIKSRLRRAFRTASNPTPGLDDAHQSFSLVTQLTTAGLCASTPVLPKSSSVPPVVKSLIRPLTVPKLQVTSFDTPASRINTILTSPWPTVACPPPTTKLKKKK